jgi:hypothetical protein
MPAKRAGRPRSERDRDIRKNFAIVEEPLERLRDEVAPPGRALARRRDGARADRRGCAGSRTSHSRIRLGESSGDYRRRSSPNSSLIGSTRRRRSRCSAAMGPLQAGKKRPCAGRPEACLQVLALQLELCSPRLIASRVEERVGGLRGLSAGVLATGPVQTTLLLSAGARARSGSRSRRARDGTMRRAGGNWTNAPGTASVVSLLRNCGQGPHGTSRGCVAHAVGLSPSRVAWALGRTLAGDPMTAPVGSELRTRCLARPDHGVATAQRRDRTGRGSVRGREPGGPVAEGPPRSPRGGEQPPGSPVR